jgi:predicted RNase H-like nuclease
MPASRQSTAATSSAATPDEAAVQAQVAAFVAALPTWWMEVLCAGDEVAGYFTLDELSAQLRTQAAAAQ